MEENITQRRTSDGEPIRKSTTPIKHRRRRRPAVVFRMSMLVFIWMICFISCFAAYMIGKNLFPEEAPKADSEVTASSRVTEESSSSADSEAVRVKTNPVPKGTVMTSSYLTECAFLGDSVIYQMGKNGDLDKKNVYSADTLTLDTYKDTYVPVGSSQVHFLSAINGAESPIYLMFGTDSLTEKTPEEAADAFSSLLNAIKNAAPDADIFVLSVPPVTEAAETAEPALLNSSIDAYNSMLLSLANSANVYFVDSNTALKNNENKLDTANALEDGIHLNEGGAKKLLDYVLCHVPA